jgi:hypothetical protein
MRVEIASLELLFFIEMKVNYNETQLHVYIK